MTWTGPLCYWTGYRARSRLRDAVEDEVSMFDFIAYFSTRLKAALMALKEAEDVFVAVEDLLHDKGADPKVQRTLNQMRDIRRKFAVILGE